MEHTASQSKPAIDLAPDTQPQAQTGIGAVLRNRNFLFLWLAQVFSQVAQQIINFALVLQVYDLTGSGAATSIVLVCFTIPGILFSAIAGVFVDRSSKRNMLIGTNVARGVIMLLFIVTTLQTRGGSAVPFVLPLIYILTLIFSSVSQFFVPAEGAMIPLLVKRNELIGANSLFNLTFTAAQLIGFAFLGPLLTPLIGYRNLYIVLFALYAICAVLTWLLPGNLESQRELKQKTSTLGDKVQAAVTDLKEGWNFIRHDSPLVMAITYWSIAITVFFMLAVMGPKYLENVLHIPTDQLSFILMPGGLGLVVGVIVVGRFSTERNRTRTIVLSMIGASILLLVFCLLPDTLRMIASWLGQPAPSIGMIQLLMGVLAFFLGILNSFITVPAQTVLQERSPEQVRARVFSAFYTVSNTLLIVPLLLAATIADFFGVVQTMVVISLLMLIISVLGYRMLSGYMDSPGVSVEPGDEAAEAFVPGNIPVPLDDARQHTLQVADTTPPRDGKQS